MLRFLYLHSEIKSNARETWCVILVSESWHILLRITAHSHNSTYFHYVKRTFAIRFTRCTIFHNGKSVFYIKRHIIFILWHIPSIYMKSLYTSFLLYMQAYSTSLSLVSLLFFASIPTAAPHCKPHSPDWWTAAAPPQSPTLLPDICHTAVLISLRLHKFW